MKLMLLKFDDIGNIGPKLIKFVINNPVIEPYTEITIHCNSVYAIYRARDGIYVVVNVGREEEWKTYVHYIAEELPEDAKPIEKLEYVFEWWECGKCGARLPDDVAEEAWLEGDCLKCEYCGELVSPERKSEVKVVWSPKEFDWSSVETGKKPDVPMVVTEVNADYTIRKLIGGKYRLTRVKWYWLEAGHDKPYIVVEKEVVKHGDIEVVIGIGYWEESHWDELPTVKEVGYYAELNYMRTPRAYYRVDKELTFDDLVELAKIEPGLVEKYNVDAVRKAIEELVREEPRKIMRFRYDWLKEIGVSKDVLVKKLEMEIEDELRHWKEYVMDWGETHPRMYSEIVKLCEELKTFDEELAKKYLSEANEFKENEAKLAEEARRRREEKEKKRIEEKRRRLLSRLRKPDWADGIVIDCEVCRGLEDCDVFWRAYPIKKSKYNNGEYYYSPTWKPVSESDELEALGEVVIIDGKTMEYEKVKENGKYVTIKIKN